MIEATLNEKKAKKKTGLSRHQEPKNSPLPWMPCAPWPGPLADVFLFKGFFFCFKGCEGLGATGFRILGLGV